MKQKSDKYLILLYDNTLNGLLSAIFDVYRLKLTHFKIIPLLDFQEQLFQPTLHIPTNKAKANRIKISLKKRTRQNLLPYLEYIFEKNTEKEQLIYRLMLQTFQTATYSKSSHTSNT